MPRCLALLCGFALVLAGTAMARPDDTSSRFAPVRTATWQLVDDYDLDGASVRLATTEGEAYRTYAADYGASTRLPLASASKWLSAVTLARLVEKGVLRWDSRVGDYLPDAPAATHDITLDQLFSHTSGMVAGEAGCLSNRQYTLQQCARLILAEPLVRPPGTAFGYGGNSMQVAGAMAEFASGRSWDYLFITEVVTPLGLTATDWTAGAFAGGYVPNSNPRIGGGARSTLDDYGKLLDMVLAGGMHQGQLFLQQATIVEMARDRIVGLEVVNSPAPEYGYGLGQWVEAKDVFGRTYRVTSPGAFGTTPWVDWHTGSNGVVLVDGFGWLMRDDMTQIRLLALRLIDKVEYLQSADPAPSGKGRQPKQPPPPSAAPARPNSPSRAPAPARLDGERRAH
jgi:CubicO group peptidase (beta-lactamase class C family)